MNFLQLKYFITVAETLNFTEAARINMVAQTAVSYQISALEKEMSVSLFTRSTRSVALTEAGAAFYEDAKALVLNAEKAVARTQTIFHGKQLKLTVGFTSLAMADFLPTVIKRFKERFPEIELALLHQDMSLGLLSKVREGLIDVACCFDMISKDNLYGITLAHFGYAGVYAVLPMDHALASRDEITVSDIQDQTLIIFDDKQLSRVDINDRDHFHLSPRQLLGAEDAESIELMVSAHAGIALLPLVNTNRFKSCKCVRLVGGAEENPPPEPQLVIAWAEENGNPSIRDFVEISSEIINASKLLG